MPTTPAESLAALRGDAEGSAILLDFDGTLSPIVAHPSLAAPEPGAVQALRTLSGYRSVVIVSGRPADDVLEILGENLRVEGGYGLRGSPEGDVALAGAAEEARGETASLKGAWVEPKAGSVAVHYRETPDPGVARAALEPRLAQIADRHGLEVIEGKMVLELVPAGAPRKGGIVERLLAEPGVRRALYAGDDLPDLEAFEALDRAQASGAIETAVRIAVRGPETPTELIERADLVVDGPAGMVALLAQLA